MTMNATDRSLLRLAILADAGVTGAAGLALTLLPGPLAALIGFPWPGALQAVGAGLIAYALWLAFGARRPPVSAGLGWAVLSVNLFWVAGSAVLLLAAPGLFNTVGQWLVAIVAVAVADFALVQYLGLRRLRRMEAASAV
jgi:hypothetical protein